VKFGELVYCGSKKSCLNFVSDPQYILHVVNNVSLIVGQ